jgi:hypothetical protein
MSSGPLTVWQRSWVNRYLFIRVHCCARLFIGPKLDPINERIAKILILLALPRGLEPLFSP